MVKNMASNSRLVIATGAFFITAVGYLLSLFIIDMLSDWELLTDLIGPELNNLLTAISFFVLIIIISIFSSNFAEYDEKIGIGFFFLILWFVCTLGLVFGGLIYQLFATSGLTINSDMIINLFYGVLTLGLIPALATVLAIQNK